MQNLITLVFFIIAVGYGGPNVLLEAPQLKDDIPEIITGFYTVHNIVDGVPVDNPGNDFIGNIAYIYKDEYFILGHYLNGIYTDEIILHQSSFRKFR